MPELAVIPPSISAMSQEAIEKVEKLEVEMLKHPQLQIETTHTLHAGMYSRTVRLPAGAMITGALIKVPTILVMNGDASVFAGDTTLRLVGHNVLAADAGRKQAFLTHAETYLTMMFATHAQTVEEAEMEFTDDHERLLSRSQPENNQTTGEVLCLA